MNRTVKIVRVGVEKTGISKATGKEWKLRDIDITWQEQGLNGMTYEQSANGQVHGDTNEEALKYHMVAGTEFERTGIYFTLSSFNDRTFTNVRVNLPEAANKIPTY